MRSLIWPAMLAGIWAVAAVLLRATPVGPGLVFGTLASLLIGVGATKSIEVRPNRWFKVGVLVGVVAALVSAAGGSLVVLADALSRGLREPAGVSSFVVFFVVSFVSYMAALILPSTATSLAWSWLQSRVGASSTS